MKQAFINKNFQPATLQVIAQADEIIEEYQAQGFALTLRQLYYQFVARDLVPNTERSYDRIGDIVNKARLAGYLDWDAIEDRTRSLTSWVRRTGPKQALQAARDSYGIDMWENQPERVEVWIEKEALSGVIHEVCGRNDVPYFSCRGYVSQSEQYVAANRFLGTRDDFGQRTTILHLGDHDPSGMDMTRDNRDRLLMFAHWDAIDLQRIALNMRQVRQYTPPPNPAKVTDSRYEAYREEFGDQSWELDALEPAVLVALIQDHIDEIRDAELWAESQERLAEEIATLDELIEETE